MAAGLGFKTFTTGEVFSAADVNGYLMQGVLVFATEAARNSAITSPQEGQFAFTKDTNSLWYYTGSAWAASGATGDIEGVTAGVGISGGGTSGTVTITNSMATAIDAKGDLVPGTGADTFSRLAVGANGTVLTADSAEATGLKWATPAGGGGKVLQVVSASTTTEVQSTSSTYASTGITASITPSSATSKVLVLVSTTVGKDNGSSNNRASFRLRRASTTVLSAFNIGYTVGQTFEMIVAYGASYLDSPATTSATTYTLEFNSEGNTSKVFVQNNSGTGSIVLLEIGA
jgi:hypothetical protein